MKDGASGLELTVRLETSLRISESSHLIVDAMTYTTMSGRFEALIPPGNYHLRVYGGKNSSTVDASKHFSVPRGKRDLDLGMLQLNTSR